MRLVTIEEFEATERQATILDAIDQLQTKQQRRGLNPLEKAALVHLERIYMRSVKHRGAVITAESIAGPVAVARRAAGRAGAACAR